MAAEKYWMSKKLLLYFKTAVLLNISHQVFFLARERTISMNLKLNIES